MKWENEKSKERFIEKRMEMFKGFSNVAASQEFLIRHNVPSHWQKKICDAYVTALGLGTYLGRMDFSTDTQVTRSVAACIEKGLNHFDSAINYRGQRAEKSLGEAFRQLFLSEKIKREEIFVATKGGFVPFEGHPEEDVAGLFQKGYVAQGIGKTSDLVAGCHCIEPAFLKNQLDRSRQNLGLETIDLYYIHNPETQLEEFPERIFYQRLFDAFTALEEARKLGKIRFYGLATWDGFREPNSSQGYLDLSKIYEVAKSASATQECGLKAIQLPFNFAMQEANLIKNQTSKSGELKSTFMVAQELGLSVAISAPLYQGRLSGDLPPFISRHYEGELASITDSQKALQFVLSAPGVDVCLTGMKAPAHIQENLGILSQKPFGKNDDVVRSILTRS